MTIDLKMASYMRYISSTFSSTIGAISLSETWTLQWASTTSDFPAHYFSSFYVIFISKFQENIFKDGFKS